MKWSALAALAASASWTAAAAKSCPGYTASNVEQSAHGLTADLKLAGPSCDIYGEDIKDLRLIVEHQTDARLHVLIQDAAEQVFQIQEDIIERPAASEFAAADSQLEFVLVKDPFSFVVARKDSGEVLFNTSSDALIFESQYVRLRTVLPPHANIYGLGEHSDALRLHVEEQYSRTMWNRDAAYIPRKTNLYGSHPMYLEHRVSGTHGVLLLNSNGMDIKFNNSEAGDLYLEYSTLGGVLDFYFFAGPTPTEVSQQHAQAMGLAAMMPYWSLGFQQAKYGYGSVETLEGVVANYSKVDIPLEVIWADIDYMDRRRDFTVNNKTFEPTKFKKFIGQVHGQEQKFVMILDPGISTDLNYSSFVRGDEIGAYLKADDGTNYHGVQWAGKVVWPDYITEAGQQWWNEEIQLFFNPETGYAINGIWIDMNEVANFCSDISCVPTLQTVETASRMRANMKRGIADAPNAQVPLNAGPTELAGDKKGLPGRDVLYPDYQIGNRGGNLSDHTLYTNITNGDGTVQYDTHNMYGLTMAKATYNSMVALHPGKRPFVLTRSTFLTSGRWAAHWFGDNASTWDDYRLLIAQVLGFSAVHNMPMVGSDVCGFNFNVQEKMCARWAMLASFMPFMRNHADISAVVQEFYRWESVTRAARKAIDARYRLLDYFYTAMHRASALGTPSMNPLFYIYPSDENTFKIDLQFFFGESILVSPVTTDDGHSVTFYLPDDVFYDFWTYEQVVGEGKNVTLDNLDWDEMPVHIRGGTVLPLRSESANTTAALRRKPFTVIVAPGADGLAAGSLVLDDGESIEAAQSDIKFAWDGTKLETSGTFDYASDVVVESVVLLGKDGNRTVGGSWSLDAPFEILESEF
jgi:alpha-glucosidase